MKKAVPIFVAATVLLLQGAHAQEVKIKKDKVTMSVSQYTELKAKAEAYDKSQAEIAQLQAALAEAKGSIRLTTFNDSASYAIGRDIYHQWSNQRLGIDGQIAGQAMADCAKGQDGWTDQMARPLLQRFQQSFEQRQRASVQDNIDAGAKFMQDISRNKSVYTTESGLKYRKIKEGNGKHPKATDRVKVHYTGTLIDGTKFDSSVDRGEPITFPLNQVIPGWTEGLQLMDEGSTYMLYIPYQLGYGEQSAGAIPPGSTLIFEVQLLEINPK